MQLGTVCGTSMNILWGPIYESFEMERLLIIMELVDGAKQRYIIIGFSIQIV
ncbi:MAG: hypothetical protein LBH02_00870 [Methanocalculaceae archaeon]|jgi:hypothetical protein|nr:hypothetical protein [Methanocalculaceae archaeon]